MPVLTCSCASAYLWLVPPQTLKLCQAVHRLHFQLLVLLGSYVKLLHTLQPHLEHSGVGGVFVCVSWWRGGVRSECALLLLLRDWKCHWS